MKFMRRRILVLAAATCAAAALAQAQTKNAEEVFKNITSFKGMTSDQVMPAMQFMSAALGVECSHCHVQGKMDADDIDHKNIARKMIAMTADLNKNSFGGKPEITCFTCHQGSAHPNGTPSVQAAFARQGRPASPTAATPAQPKTADELINRYISAMGGEEAIRKITRRIQIGAVEMGESATPVEVITQAPNKRISINKTANGESITAFDGKSGWMGGGTRPARAMSPVDAWGASVDAEFYLGLRIKELFGKQPLRVSRAATKVNGFDCDMLTGTAPDGSPIRFFFDRETGLLARVVRYTQTSLGRMPTQVDYADYRVSDGVKIPFRWTLARPNGRFAIQVAEVKNNPQIDPARFNKP